MSVNTAPLAFVSVILPCINDFDRHVERQRSQNSNSHKSASDVTATMTVTVSAADNIVSGHLNFQESHIRQFHAFNYLLIFFYSSMKIF